MHGFANADAVDAAYAAESTGHLNIAHDLGIDPGLCHMHASCIRSQCLFNDIVLNRHVLIY